MSPGVAALHKFQDAPLYYHCVVALHNLSFTASRGLFRQVSKMCCSPECVQDMSSLVAPVTLMQW